MKHPHCKCCANPCHVKAHTVACKRCVAEASS